MYRTFWLLPFVFGCQETMVNTVDPSPDVEILRPLDGSSFIPGVATEFCASVIDNDELGVLQVTLQSSVDGVLATTDDFTSCPGGNAGLLLSLSDDHHALQLTAVDSRGQAISEIIEIDPEPNTPPSCEVSAPGYATVWFEGLVVPFDVVVTDAETSAEQLDVAFASDADGVFWSGSADTSGVISFGYDALTAGNHNITFTVVDPRGATDVCSIPITIEPCIDADSDGVTVCDGDCNDQIAERFPGNPEVPDGLDNDCNNLVDEGTYLYDDDGDTFSEVQGDCDDDDDAIFPGASEIADNGIDEDCNGFDTVTCYVDADDDDHGASTTLLASDGDCHDPYETSSPGDCDDDDAASYPGAVETPDDGTDQDCNGVDAITCAIDNDQDGFGWLLTTVALDGSCDTSHRESTLATDCDDANPLRYPGNPEIADDGIDQDCTNADTITCFADADADGYGNSSTQLADDGSCDAAANEAAVSGDCVDDPAGTGGVPGNQIFPGATDVPDDGVDQDCSGDDTVICVIDADQDGYGGISTLTTQATDGSCDRLQSESTSADDCNDASAAVHPGATDLAGDGIDQDCLDGDAAVCFVDSDGDGYGTDPSSPITAADGSCDLADGESAVSTDCDDNDAAVHPGATDTPNDTIDQDCSGSDVVTCFVDADFDGFGTAAGTTVQAEDGTCDRADQESTVDTDCDDNNPAISPAVTDVPGDGVDQDCFSGDAAACFVDADGDGYGATAAISILGLDGSCDAADGESTTADDCNDNNGAVHPNQPEIIEDGIDQDCDGGDAIWCVVDGDKDGFGIEAGTPVLASDGSCDASDGESASSDDCDDGDASIHPGSLELWGDGIDQDCSGADTVSCYIDSDGDGQGNDAGLSLPAADGTCDTADRESTNRLDCNDALVTVYDGATEIPDDGVDQDCSGKDRVTCYVDDDQDGFGALPASVTYADDAQCLTSRKEAGDASDCDDASAAIHPGATDIADDTIDQDCSGADTVACTVDSDGDGFGTTAGTPILAADGSCDISQGESANATDCVDDPIGVLDRWNNPVPGNQIYPGAPEAPDDDVDQDCNTFDLVQCFVDNDQDGYGSDSGAVAFANDGSCDTGDREASSSDDCVDNPAGVGGIAGDLIHPGGTDLPDDGVDQDCNNFDTITCFVDTDRDGYGNDGAVTTLADDGICDTSQGESATADDCIDDPVGVYDNDLPPNLIPGDQIHPGVTDIFGNGVDENCDGADGVDLDGDGFIADWTGGDDCNDSDPNTYPGAPEGSLYPTTRDGRDNDCDGVCDEELIVEGDLIITEVMINPNGVPDSDGEWFEIYNLSGQPITMCGGWRVEDDLDDWFDVLQTVRIPADGYVVFTRNAVPAENGGISGGIQYWNMDLGNGQPDVGWTDEIVLVFEGTEIDRLVWPATFDSTGNSKELKLSAYDHLSNDDTDNNWCLATESDTYDTVNNNDGTPGAPPNTACN